MLLTSNVYIDGVKTLFYAVVGYGVTIISTGCITFTTGDCITNPLISL